ncbi:hypothetical protein DFP72DRAFT_1045692 [Ephemerocybe angulata]|uniref:Uncharacterized protein n=1 Tax=Ephemerocybe angulata TaxID=980116 RepID=A0A8H6M5A8_9AGAR|nr:hypothetical protein DFP72DRAFT_1045692 [Tulosesus angulatus]
MTEGDKSSPPLALIADQWPSSCYLKCGCPCTRCLLKAGLGWREKERDGANVGGTKRRAGRHDGWLVSVSTSMNFTDQRWSSNPVDTQEHHPRDHPLTPNDHPGAPRDRPETPNDCPETPRDYPGAPSDSPVTPSTDALYNALLIDEGQPRQEVVIPRSGLPLSGRSRSYGARERTLELPHHSHHGAIAAGCPTLIKPSEVVPTFSKLLSELIPKYPDPAAVASHWAVFRRSRRFSRSDGSHILDRQRPSRPYHQGNGGQASDADGPRAGREDPHYHRDSVKRGGEDLCVAARTVVWGKVNNEIMVSRCIETALGLLAVYFASRTRLWCYGLDVSDIRAELGCFCVSPVGLRFMLGLTFTMLSFDVGERKRINRAGGRAMRIYCGTDDERKDHVQSLGARSAVCFGCRIIGLETTKQLRGCGIRNCMRHADICVACVVASILRNSEQLLKAGAHGVGHYVLSA